MALITLTSDIGSPDYLVGAIKAQLLQLIPDAKVFVQKQRNAQWEGSFNFWFDQKGLKYKESP